MTQRVYIKFQISKFAGEHLAHNYHKEFGLPVVSLICEMMNLVVQQL